MEIDWVEISEVDTELFDKLMAFYEQAFPVEVREPEEIFKISMKHAEINDFNNYRFLVGMEGEQIISFATGHYFAEINTGFIVYIVTNPSIRNRGLGSKTLTKLEEMLNEDALNAGFSALDRIVLETETSDMVHTNEEKEACIKRNKFFERNKFTLTNVIDYKQPPLHNSDVSIPLNLYEKKYKGGETTKETLEEVIIVLFKEKYYDINKIDKSVLANCIREMGVENRYINFH
ncbi:GNAT family N-acetyltransferase [Halobacillus kuroshimensis]|nr:GNAT family N-acetyltransferase [Halobacillus kuroshimensis]